MVHNCGICKEEIKNGEQIYQLKFGSINRDEMGGTGFDEAKSYSVHGYIHIRCID